MAELAFNAEVRNKTGKEDAKKLRTRNLIPAVVYGRAMEPVHCAIAKNEVNKLKRVNKNALIDLKVGSEDLTVIVREAQKHPITHEFEHVDFQAVALDQPIKVDVELAFNGTPIGKKDGGIFTPLVKKVKVECLPEKIPQVITLDISGLATGQSLHVSDINAEGFKVVTSAKIALCQVSAVKEEAEATADAAAPAAATAAAAPAAAPAAK